MVGTMQIRQQGWNIIFSTYGVKITNNVLLSRFYQYVGHLIENSSLQEKSKSLRYSDAAKLSSKQKKR